jgi:hypothetical protein
MYNIAEFIIIVTYLSWLKITPLLTFLIKPEHGKIEKTY